MSWAVQHALLLAHVVVGALWLGGMVYSLVVVQPKAARFFAGAGSGEDQEVFTATLASGNRYPVLGLIAALAGSGVWLWWGYGGAGGAGVYVAKSALLAVATAIFVFVSWRHWPRRVFATPAERPALQRQLRICAWAMVTLVGTAFALAVLTAH